MIICRKQYFFLGKRNQKAAGYTLRFFINTTCYGENRHLGTTDATHTQIFRHQHNNVIINDVFYCVTLAHESAKAKKDELS